MRSGDLAGIQAAHTADHRVSTRPAGAHDQKVVCTPRDWDPFVVATGMRKTPPAAHTSSSDGAGSTARMCQEELLCVASGPTGVPQRVAVIFSEHDDYLPPCPTWRRGGTPVLWFRGHDVSPD